MGWRQHLYDPPTIFLLSAMSGWCVLFGPLRFPVLSTLVFRGDFVYLRWCCHLPSRDFTSHDSNERDDGLKQDIIAFPQNRAFAPPRSRGERKKVWSLNRLSCLGKKKVSLGSDMLFVCLVLTCFSYKLGYDRSWNLITELEGQANQMK